MRLPATCFRRPFALASIVLTTAPALGGGELIFWDADVPGVWSSPFNWSGNSVPTPSDAVLIASGSLVTVDVNPTIEAFTLTSPGTTMVCNGRTVQVLINNPLSCCSKVLAGQLDLISSTWICPTAFQTQGLVRVANSNFDVGEIAILPGGEMRTVGTQAIDSPFTISPGKSEGLLAITPSTWVRFDPGSKHINGTIQHYGRIRIDPAAVLYMNGSNHFTGGGTIELVGPNALMTGWTGSETVVLESFVVGAGTLGNNSLNFELIAPYSVTANGATPLSIDPAASFVNRSSLIAAPGSTLRLQPGVFDGSSSSSVIRALDTGLVELNACVVYDGALATEGSGRIRVVGNTTSFQGIHTNDGLEINGILEVPNGINPRFIDTIRNTGEVRVLATTASTVLYIDNVNTDGVRLSGGGTILLADSPNNIVAGWNGGEVLRNVDNTIRGAGSLGNNSINIVNEADGLVEADAANILSIDPAVSVTNAGTLRAQSGGRLRLQPGVFDGSAPTAVIEALDNSLVELNGTSLVGGLLRSEGTGVVRVIGNTTTLSAPAAGQPLTIEGTLDIPNGINPRLVDSIVNTGTIHMNATNASTVLYIDNSATAGVALSGGGTVELSDSPNNIIAAWNGGETLTNVDNTIRGAGNVGNNSTNIVNAADGRIEANRTNALVFDPASSVTNYGVIAATDGGTLRLQPGLFDQPTTESVIEAREGSLVQLNGTALYRGLLRSVGTGVVRVQSLSSLQGDGAALPLTVDGVLEIPNGLGIRLIDNIENKGVIRLLASNASSILYVDNAASAGVQLTGGGTLQLGNSNLNIITAFNGGETLTNVDNTISGGGIIGNNSALFVNQGTVLADQSSPLIIDTAAGSWQNSGDALAAAGSLLRSQEAIVMTAGSIGADGEVEVVANSISMTGGSLRGAGRIDSNVTVTAGAIEPGPVFGNDPLGRLTIEGQVSLAPQSNVVMELGGYLPGINFDVLDVDGTATLDGTLTIKFADGFEPFVGTSFTVIAADSVQGTFDSVTGPGTFTVLYRAQTVTVVVNSLTPPCDLADLDCDGDIDAADLGSMLGAWGACSDCDTCTADLDGDCVVGAADLAVLLGSWQ